jgi:hypothetical protein
MWRFVEHGRLRAIGVRIFALPKKSQNCCIRGSASAAATDARIAQFAQRRG